MASTKIAFVASPHEEAQDAFTRLTHRYGNVDPADADAVVALGGDRVELRGFGAFSTKERAARVGRNPRTGEAVQVDKKYVPYFKCGKDLRDRLNAD